MWTCGYEIMTVNKICATYELVAMKMKNDGLGCQDRSREQLSIRAAATSARNLLFFSRKKKLHSPKGANIYYMKVQVGD